MINSDSTNKLNKFYNLNFIAILILGTVAYLIKVFELVSPALADVSVLPIIDLVIITPVVIGAKYFFGLRSKSEKANSSGTQRELYSKYSLYIIILIDTAYLVNLLIFLLTINLIYILIAVLLLILNVIYRPVNEALHKV